MGTTDEDHVNLSDILLEFDKGREIVRAEDDEAAKKAARSPAYVIDAERALLGAAFVDGENVMNICEDEGLSPSDFYAPMHRDIFGAMRSLNSKRREVTAISVADELNRKALLDDIGGPAYLSQLEANVLTAADAASNARMIVEKSRLRAIMVECERTAARARLGESSHDIIDTASARLMEIERRASSSSFVDLQAVAKDMLGTVVALGGADTSMSTGFIDLDKYLKMRPGDLIIVAARPSMGKSQLVVDIANSFALDRDEAVSFFSLEMDAAQLMKRAVGSRCGVNLDKPRMDADEQQRVLAATAEIAESRLRIDDTPGLKIGDIRSRARSMSRRDDTGLVIVDYLQLVSSDEDYGNKATEVGDVSKGLKNIARELRCPVIALSQLNRAVEMRADKRPMMSDLRESGAIEQDADTIAFVFREEYYLRENTPEDMVGVSEIIVAKARNGPTGKVSMYFDKELPRFANLADRRIYR